MKTIRQAKMVLAGTRPRIYEVELVDLGQPREARFVVNFRYGWQGAVLEEGTRTPEPVPEQTGIRLFESVIAARRNQGYQLEGEAAPTVGKAPIAAVPTGATPRDMALAGRLRAIDSLSDGDAAGLIRRLGELRMRSLCAPLAAAAREIAREQKRLRALRALPYALHRTDDGTSNIDAVLESLTMAGDEPTAETATMLRTVRDRRLAPKWADAPALLGTAATLGDAQARGDAALAYFRASVAAPGPSDSGDKRAASTALMAVYALGTHDPAARAMILAVLDGIPFAPPLFRAVRRILQVAEATDDAEVLSLLNRRFDTEASSVPHGWRQTDGSRNTYLGGRVVTIGQELKKASSPFAYTRATRSYLRRRGWRTLRRLGEAGDAAYVTLATAVLATLDDAAPASDAAPARRAVATEPPFANRYSANHILHGKRTRIATREPGLHWRFIGAPASATTREEPFGALWQAQPDALWRLLVSAKAGAVAGFAARALRESTAFLDSRPVQDIIRLVSDWAPHRERLDLGLFLAERHIARHGLDPDLATALIGEPTRGGALIRLYLGARPEILAGDVALFAALLRGGSAEAFDWLAPLATTAAAQQRPDQRSDTLARLIAEMETGRSPALDMARAKPLAALLGRCFAAEIAALEAGSIRRLGETGNDAVRYLAAMLAASRADGPEIIDIGGLATSADPDLRAAGIALFARRSLDAIAADVEALARFLTADAKEPRDAARPIADRLARERPFAARALAERILPTLYRTELHEGLREDVLAVLTHELKLAALSLGVETIWTLLRARSEPARRLGAALLDGKTAGDFSIRQLARIGCNDQVMARQWAVAALEVRIEDVRKAPDEGFALLDCAFDDAREAGYRLYREHLKPEDWTPEALVAVSDLTTEPAQRFGREMIGRVFQAKDAELLLMRLAEHPAPGFRLLVARLMRDWVGDSVERLKRLVPTIETTLLQVRRGRAAKDQMLAFLESQLEQSESTEGKARRQLLAPVVEKLVASAAVGDRARTLALLLKIKQTEPDLAPLARIVPREARR